MRLRNMPTGLIAAVLLIAWPGNGQALGGFVEEFTDKDEWITAVGDFTTIDFTGFPDGTFITDQYADLGILFTDGNDTFFFTPASSMTVGGSMATATSPWSSTPPRPGSVWTSPGS